MLISAEWWRQRGKSVNTHQRGVLVLLHGWNKCSSPLQCRTTPAAELKASSSQPTAEAPGPPGRSKEVGLFLQPIPDNSVYLHFACWSAPEHCVMEKHWLSHMCLLTHDLSHTNILLAWSCEQALPAKITLLKPCVLICNQHNFLCQTLTDAVASVLNLSADFKEKKKKTDQNLFSDSHCSYSCCTMKHILNMQLLCFHRVFVIS